MMTLRDRPMDGDGGAGGASSAKVGLARCDETLSNIAKLRERWHDSSTLQGLSLVKDYLEGRLEIALGLEVVGGSASRDVDRSDKVRPILIRLKVSSAQREHFIADHCLEFLNSEKRRRWDQQFMFVENVKIVECSDGVLPAIVGFQLIDELTGIRGCPLHFAFSRGYEFLPIFSSREISVLRIAGAERGASKGDSYMIECRSDVMDNIAHDRGELQGHTVGRDVCNSDLPLVWLGADNKVVITSAGNIAGGVCKLAKVSIGPFDL